MKNEKLFFDLISPFYALADSYFSSPLQEAGLLLQKEIALQGLTVLDVGTGTGSWAKILSDSGAKVHGLDFSKRLLKKAIAKHGSSISFSLGDALELPFEDKSFDIVTASLVLHGPSQKKRQLILKEMNRVSRKYIVIHDYYGPGRALIHLAEYLEQSDYYVFRKNFEGELKEKFSDIKVLPSAPGLALYLIRKEL